MLFLGLAGSSAAQIPGQDYHNVPFHFTVRLPVGYDVCPGDPLVTDHGLMLVAVGLPCERASAYKPPAIGIYAGFDAAYLAETIEQFALEDCYSPYGEGTPSLKIPYDGLSVPGKRSMICERELPQGVLRVEVMTLAVRPGDKARRQGPATRPG
jgi:hypothetical protein